MKYAGFVILLMVWHSALGLDIPQSSKYDSRIQYTNYNDGDVVAIRAYPGLGTQIVFAPHEEIVDIASGFMEGWEFSNSKNILYLKPKSIKGEDGAFLPSEAGKWDTNLLVTTNVRLYAFDLLLLPSRQDSKLRRDNRTAYRIQFRYLADEAAQAKQAAEKNLANAQLERKSIPINWNYSMQIGRHSDNIAPTMAYDDGRFTYLKFQNNRDFPAVFLVAADKSESLVNSHLEPSIPNGAKDILVVHRVAREMALRFGSAVVGIYNDSFDPDGIAPQQGTTVPSVKRIFRLNGDSQDE